MKPAVFYIFLKVLVVALGISAYQLGRFDGEDAERKRHRDIIVNCLIDKKENDKTYLDVTVCIMKGHNNEYGEEN